MSKRGLTVSWSVYIIVDGDFILITNCSESYPSACAAQTNSISDALKLYTPGETGCTTFPLLKTIAVVGVTVTDTSFALAIHTQNSANNDNANP